ITIVSNSVACIGDMATFTISVYPTPTVTTINNISVCTNQLICVPNFTGCPVISTYTWINSNSTIGLTSTGVGNIPCFMAINPNNVVNSSIVNVTPSENGCVGPVSAFTISVYPFPTLTVTTNHPFMLCVGDSAILTASGANTYNWNPSYNLNSNTGAVVIAQPVSNTIYTVTGSSNYGCISTDTITQFVNNCTGINTFANNINITLYPNPNNGNFVIETNQTDKQTLQILDVTGKLILQQTINGKTTIDASSLDNGIYFVQINTSQGLFTKKIIVQR
ncbi:MAG TPA: T9SS type A sorting domain-containing protein, partial [Bacteroidia bacterium]|nr:T9SS type A sorting domain-containing protein [Bacteroidia bacterium]